MVSKKVTLINKLGLHARASSLLIKTASRFAASITLQYKNRQADAKSIMDVMMLGAACGSDITISAEGEDEELALSTLETLIADRFGEEE